MGFDLEKLFLLLHEKIFRLDTLLENHNTLSAISPAVYKLSCGATPCQRLVKRQETLLNTVFLFKDVLIMFAILWTWSIVE